MKILTAWLSLSLLTATSARSEDSKLELEQEILQDILKNTTVSAVAIEDAGLAKCFAVRFFDAEISTKEGDGWMRQRAVYAKTAAGLRKVSDPGTDAKMPELLNLVNPTFVLTTEAHGELMLAAIKTLFPPRFDGDYKPRMVRKGTTWLLITDTFFERFSGFVVETDAAGKITSIKRSLSITE